MLDLHLSVVFGGSFINIVSLRVKNFQELWQSHEELRILILINDLVNHTHCTVNLSLLKLWVQLRLFLISLLVLGHFEFLQLFLMLLHGLLSGLFIYEFIVQVLQVV